VKHNIYILLHACSATVRLLHSWVGQMVPGLPIGHCAGSSNNLVPRGAKLSAIDVTLKVLFERLYWFQDWAHLRPESTVCVLPQPHCSLNKYFSTGTPYWRLCRKLQQFGAKGCQAERNSRDTKSILWAFVLVSGLSPIELWVKCPAPTTPLFTPQLFLDFRTIFSDVAPHSLSATIHQAIWHRPGTQPAITV